MSSICIFELNRPNATYFSGETITGNIILNTPEIENIKNICIIFNGEGKVKWSESTTYKSHEVYLKNCNIIYTNTTLPAGEHKWNFKIPLPLQCPTSLEGKYGKVRYKIILKIHRPYHFDKLFKKPVNIIKTIDLNLDPMFKQPLTCEKIKTLRYLTHSKDEIISSLFIPLSAYAPGETIKYFLNIENKSKTQVESYYIEFSRKMIFTANKPKKNWRKCKDVLLSDIIMENCLCHTNRIIDGEVTIPTTPPTTVIDDIISVQYKLKVILNLSGFSRDPTLSVPIFIGTIPIRETTTSRETIANFSRPPIEHAMEELRAMNFSSRESVEPVIGVQNFNTDLPPSYSEIEPTRFEEATATSSYSRQSVERVMEELKAIDSLVSESVESATEEIQETKVQHFNDDLPPSYSEIEPFRFEEATAKNSYSINTDSHAENP